MRPESNISEMKAILATVPPPFEKMANVEIERWLRHIQRRAENGWDGRLRALRKDGAPATIPQPGLLATASDRGGREGAAAGRQVIRAFSKSL
jgi:hypothetical protein